MGRLAIAIAGSTGSGKSTLARDLAGTLDAAILHTDDYYRPLDHLTYEQRCEVNFDDPAAVDLDLLESQVGRLLLGEAIAAPKYDFSRHTRFPDTRPVTPKPFVLIEGVFALCSPRLLSRLWMSVFVDTPEPECLRRRVVRDVRERGRTPEEVIARFTGHVAPSFRRFVLPTREFATLVVSGEGDREANVRAVLNLLPTAISLR